MAAINPVNALPADYRLGEYTIESVLGQGGFGITYLARDTKLSSQVAIKEYFPQAFAARQEQSTIVPRTYSNPSAEENYRWGLQEFLKEAQALAKFKHNNIVRVLRFLEANGTAYMVMEYEEGESLADHLRKHGGFLDEPMLLQVFLPILSGLQAVHNAGLLHLDIKPDNIYLRTNGKPMLIDFGSARHTTHQSEASKKIALTPGYSALEAYPNQGEQGPWSDVYSIGATLYRCMTGKAPTDALERFQTIGRDQPDPLVMATEFDRPFYSSHIRECVDWALVLDREDRPHTAFALQQGLMGKEMTNEQTEQNQDAYSYRSGFIGTLNVKRPKQEKQKYKWKLWERVVAALLSVALIAMILIQTNTITQDQLFYGIDIVRAKINGMLTTTKAGINGQEAEAVDSDAAVETVELEPLTGQRLATPFNTDKVLVHTLTGHQKRVQALAFLGDDLVASADADGIVKVWDIAAGNLLHTLNEEHRSTGIIAASPDGKWLALPADRNTIQLWGVHEAATAGELKDDAGGILALTFSPDSSSVAAVNDSHNVVLWDMTTREIRNTLSHDGDQILSVTFSPNGRWVATGSAGGEIRYWSIETGKVLGSFKASAEKITTVAFSPDGQRLASGGPENHLKVWDTGGGGHDIRFAETPRSVYAVTFSPDNRWLITASAASAIQIWDLETGDLHQQLGDHERNVYSVTLSPDGSIIASGGDDMTVRIWQSP